MSVTVTWLQSTSPIIASYDLEYSADAVTWSTLTSISHTILGPNWDSTNSVFYYVHTGGTISTWYRIRAVDTNGATSSWSAGFQPAGAYVPPWETVNSILEHAAAELGLGVVTSPFTSTDENIIQLRYLLTSCGRELIHTRQWNHLRKEALFTTVAGQSEYPFEPDYHNMFDQTGWNRTNRLPLGGPLSPQEWQYLKARLVGVVFTVLFRPTDRMIHIYPDNPTPGGYQIAYEYSSAWWISPSGTPDTLTSDEPTAGTDYVWFDPLLITRKLKLEFLKAKGFDTTSAEQDYQRSLEAVKGHDYPGSVLSLTRRSPLRGADILIGQQSVPITGFGS